jgi:UDP-glucose 4-epimerase
MKVVVTGCAGLIGSHLVDNLLEKNFKVVGIDDLSFGRKINLTKAESNPNFSFIKGDCKDISNILIGKNYDAILHLASIKKPWGNKLSSNYVLDQNIDMTREIIKYCLSNNTFLLFTSTSDVYGNSKNFLESEKITIGPPTNERYSYSMSKLISEQYIFNEINQLNLNATVIRIFGCASERSKKSWSAGHIPIFVSNALNDIEINIHGDGLQTRSISSAIDIAEGISQTLINKNKLNGEIINIGTSEETTVKEVADYIVNKTNSKSKITYTPREEIFGDYDEILRRFANTDKAKKTLNFKIKYSTFKVIDQIIESFSDPSSMYYFKKND